MTTDELFRERIFDVALNGAAQRSSAVRAILAGHFDNPIDDFRGERDAQLSIDQVGVELRDEQPHDLPQVLVAERLEHDDLVDAVDELRVERALDLSEHHVRYALVDGG